MNPGFTVLTPRTRLVLHVACASLAGGFSAWAQMPVAPAAMLRPAVELNSPMSVTPVGATAADLAGSAPDKTPPAALPPEVVLKKAAKLSLGGTGEMGVPAGRTVKLVKVEGGQAFIDWNGATGSVPVADTDLAERAAKLAAQPAESPVARLSPPPTPPPAPAAKLPAELSFLLNTHSELTPELRGVAVRAAWESGNWIEYSDAIGAALARDFTSGDVDRAPWKDRLRLATLFRSLGRLEGDYAIPLLTQRVRYRNAEVVPAQELRQLLSDERFKSQFAPVFGGAEGWPRPSPVARRIDTETAVALLSQREFTEILATTLTDSDYAPGVWRVLSDLQKHAADKVTAYPALAVALAVVYDLPLPAGWPHPQVEMSDIPLAQGNWNDLFDYYTGENEAGKLYVDLRTLSADTLKYVIDAPLKIDELKWARDNVTTDRANFDKVFKAVAYDRDRIRDQKFYWKDGPYTLANIRKKEGICVDQAYFAWIAGKAHGLPTLFFVGQGADGGHAWFGFLGDKGWMMDAGRYENQNFVVGQAINPQTRDLINDHELAFISKFSAQATNYQYSRNMLALAALPLPTWTMENRRALFNGALESCPELPEVWSAVSTVLQEIGDQEMLSAHYRRMIEQFTKQDDVRQPVQKSLAEVERKRGNEAEANRLQEAMLDGRQDLGLRAAWDLIQEKLATKDYTRAGDDYQLVLKKFGHAGGDLFYVVVRPYVQALASSGESARATKALKDADALFSQDPMNIIRQDMDKLEETLAKPAVGGAEKRP